VTENGSTDPSGKPLPVMKVKKSSMMLAGIAILIILVIAVTVFVLSPGNPGSSSSPAPTLPPVTVAPTIPAVTEVTTEPAPTIAETARPTQPVDFVLVPSDQVNCGLTCRQLEATITNTGYETAHAVCITLRIHNSRNDVIPVNGNPSLQQCVGEIAAGASKTEPITVNADCGPFATNCVGQTLTLETTATSTEKTVRFPDQQVAV
jgi:hypothetical protein